MWEEICLCYVRGNINMLQLYYISFQCVCILKEMIMSKTGKVRLSVIIVPQTFSKWMLVNHGVKTWWIMVWKHGESWCDNNSLIKGKFWSCLHNSREWWVKLPISRVLRNNFSISTIILLESFTLTVHPTCTNYCSNLYSMYNLSLHYRLLLSRFCFDMIHLFLPLDLKLALTC